MKILIAASEVVPYAKTGGLADVAGALPLALEKSGHEVIVVLPKYGSIQDAKFNITSIKSDISAATMGKNIKVYFVENEMYYQRAGLYGDKNGDFTDNLSRFSYFCKRTLNLLKEIDFKADVAHVHDWQACLIPVYLKTIFANDPFYQAMKTVLTIHNIGYQGLFAKDEFPKTGLDWSYYNMEMLEFYDKVNVLKGGIVFSDLINTVSPTYAKEMQTKEFAFGLEGVLNKRKNDIYGILNGLDYDIWDPENDKFIASDFTPLKMEGKDKCKENLQKICNLPAKKSIPLCGIVSRLAEQKGFDILAGAIDTVCNMGLQLVILGTGDIKYHDLLEGIVKKYPEVVSLNLKFDDTLAHKIYAGSDIFLMPSKYEPCGLGQLIALRYGTIPLVYKTGGLADTVSADNGFIFDEYSSERLVHTIKEALNLFKNKNKWPDLVRKAMYYDFSWHGAAKKYIQLYEKAERK